MNTSIKSNFGPDLAVGRRSFNKLGVVLSILCAIHCFFTPVLLVMMPWMSGYIENDVFHVLMLAIVLMVSVMSSIKSTRIEKSNLFLMAFGLLFLILGVVSHYNHSADGEVHGIYHLLIENSLTVTGGVLLAVSHYKRLKNCRCGHS